jgi:hypothetical protein
MALDPLEYLVIGSEEAEHLAPLAGELLSLLTSEDIEQVARDIPNNYSATMLLFEHSWAIDLKEAIKNASGIVVSGRLMAPDVLQELEEELQTSQPLVGQDYAAVKATQ